MICTCCQRPIAGKPGYAVRLGIFEELGPREVIRIGWADRGLCQSCTARIEHAQQRRRAARRRVMGSVA